MTYVGGSDDRSGRSDEHGAAVAASNAAALGGSPSPRRWGASPSPSVVDDGAAALDETPDNRWLALGVVTWLAVFAVALLMLPGATDTLQLLGRSLVILGTAMVVNAGIFHRAFAPIVSARTIRLARSEAADAEVVDAATTRGITTHTIRFADHRGVPRETELPLAGAPRIGAAVAIRFDREDPAWALDEFSATVGLRRLQAVGHAMAVLGLVGIVAGLLAVLA